jgi:CHAT domain-containing protein
VPDGVLGYLPFDILLTTSDTVFEESRRADYANLPYLFIKQPITYSYSSTHRFTETQPKAQKKRLLAIVPEYANAHTIESDALPALPYALEEARGVLSHWKGDLLYAGEASKTAFMNKAPEYQLLHLGMHTVINDENPMLSRFAFTNDPQGTELDLTASELYGMRLNASLVVLSACNTGSGQLRSGEGIMNLTRGFIYAGVPSIVMTNWEVNDQSGARLMELFYQNLHKGMSKDIALQHARKDYLLEANMLKAHPFFWAAYQLVGDPEPLHFHKKNSAFLWVMAVFIVMIVFWWIIKKGNRLPEKLPISL